ncbi:ABC transporter permease [Ferrimonas pelagia]|uniref:ABC transporter permease n=1 Tax=Ferrimonas pelagia TaxID=1177826 RepID=A0ABP9FET6_9GAMM
MPNASLSARFAMLGNYLRTAVRALWKQKLHTGLNLMGLSVGLAATLLIVLWVRFELSYDQMHPNADSSYRLSSTITEYGISLAIAPPGLMGHFTDWPEIDQATYLYKTMAPINLFLLDEQPLQLEHFYGADVHLTDLFALSPIAGDLHRVLTEPNLLALSQQQALRLFGRTDVIGETLDWRIGQPMTVTAVFADLPANTHLAIEAITYKETLRAPYGDQLETLKTNLGYLYVRPNAETDFKHLTSKMLDLFTERKYNIQFELQPLTHIHLNSNRMHEMKANGSAQAVFLASGLALFILLIASFNFINLSTARAGLRAKEVGIRKALGVNRSQLIGQFLLETLLLTALASLLACIWLELAQPQFNQMMNSTLTIHYFSELGVILLGQFLLVGLLAGAYPAFYLSAFQPARVLSGDLNRGFGAARLRKLLIGLQGAVSIGLLITSCGFFSQLQLMQNQPLGYAKDGRLLVKQLSREVLRQQDEIHRTMEGLDSVNSATILNSAPTETYNSRPTIQTQGLELEGIGMKMGTANLAETLGLTLLAGRDFSHEFRADRFNFQTKTCGVIISREASQLAGFAEPRDAVGQTWQWQGMNDTIKGTIVGVVEQFKIGPAQVDSGPMFFTHSQSNSPRAELLLHLNESFSMADLDEIQTRLQQLMPIHPIELSFLDAEFQALFDAQRREQNLLFSFTMLAIGLTCIGLFGLAAFSCERRSKEIAMRKVLGGSYARIITLINKEFVALVALGSLLAWPLAHWGLSRWLEHFIHRVDLAWWWFPAATAVVLAITVATVSALALNTARQRPALTLRDE